MEKYGFKVKAISTQSARTAWLLQPQTTCKHYVEKLLSEGHNARCKAEKSSEYPIGTLSTKLKAPSYAPAHQTNKALPQSLVHPSSDVEKLFSRLSSPYDAIIFGLAAPAILALAADPLLAMVDTAFIGRLGQIDLAALAVNNSLFSFSFVVFNFLATATTPTVAAALAAGDQKKAGRTITQAVMLALVLGISVWALLITCADPALKLMGVDEHDTNLLNLARDFLIFRAPAAPAALLITVCQGIFRGLSDMTTPLLVTLGTNAVHLLLDLALIFGMQAGLTGAAISTSTSEWLAAAVYALLVWGRRDQLGLSPLPRMDLNGMGDEVLGFMKAGGAVLMRTMVLLGAKTLAAVVATRLGPAEVGAHQVMSQVWVLSSLIIDSLAIAGQTMVAVKLGQGDTKGARQVTERLLQLGVALGGVMAAGLTLSAPFWPSIFSQDPETIADINRIMPLALAMLPINAVAYVLDGALVGASDFTFLVQAMALASALAASLLAAVEPCGLGLEGVWQAMSLLMLGRFTTLFWRFYSNTGPLSAPPELTHSQPPLPQQQQHHSQPPLVPQQQHKAAAKPTSATHDTAEPVLVSASSGSSSPRLRVNGLSVSSLSSVDDLLFPQKLDSGSFQNNVVCSNSIVTASRAQAESAEKLPDSLETRLEKSRASSPNRPLVGSSKVAGESNGMGSRKDSLIDLSLGVSEHPIVLSVGGHFELQDVSSTVLSKSSHGDGCN